MNVVFSTPDGPLEGFTEAEFRVAINDDGVGRLVGPPEVISGITGPITCSVAGFPVFRWSPEESNENYGDDDSFTINGRGRTGALDRAIVLPVGYPNYTERTRTEQGSPFGIWAALLAEAQGRNRVLDITPSWTATHDTNGEPWKETVDIQLEPGTTLRSLLSNVTEVEGAEWFLQPNGELDAATTLGEDLSGEVVLFVSRQQVSRNRRLSKRDQRQTVYIEASTGVSEAVNSLSEDAGEIWLEAQDYADSLSRQAIADKLADKYDNPQEEVDINVSPDCGIFDTFTVGDRIGLDTGSGTIQTVRVVGALITVTDTIEVELTLISEVALRQQKIDRAIEAKADVQLAATPAIQRRHGLVTADKFLSGAVGDAVAISSEDYVPGSQGWVIRGDGDAEFNSVVVRGDLESDNYDPGVDGWRLDRDGTLELNEGTFRGGLVGGTINIGGADGFYADGVDGIWLGSSSFDTAAFRVSLTGQARAANMLLTNGTLTGGSINIGNGTFTVSTSGAISATSGSISGNLVTSGISAGNITAGTLSVDRIAAGSITGAKISGGTIEGANIASGTIGGVNIADLAVTSGKVANNAVITRTISNGNVTDAKIASLTVDKLTGATISGFNVSALALSALTFTMGNISISAIGNSLTGATVITSTRGSFTGSGSLTLAALRAPNAPAVALADSTAARFDAQGGIRPLSSSRKAKTEIIDAPAYPSIFNLRPVHYRMIADDTRSVDYGLIAEEVDELGITGLVSRDADGEPRAVNYELVGLMLVPHVRDLVERVSALEEGTRAE